MFRLGRRHIIFLYIPGGDGIHQDVFGRQFAGCLSGHADDAASARRIADAGRIIDGRCQIDDAPAALVCHNAPDQLRAEESAGQIDLKLPPPVPFVDLEHGFRPENPGGVDQNVNPAKSIAGLLDDIGGLEAVGDVSVQGNRPAAGRLDFPRQFICPFNVDVVDGDGRPMMRQSQGDPPANAGAGARRQRVAAA